MLFISRYKDEKAPLHKTDQLHFIGIKPDTVVLPKLFRH